MALEENQVLHSLEIILEPLAVNICWMDLILRDGAVIQRTPHRGAYELVDGDFPDHVQNNLGLNLGDLLGQALAESVNENFRLTARIAALEANVLLLADQLAVEREAHLKAAEERDVLIAQLQEKSGDAGE